MSNDSPSIAPRTEPMDIMCPLIFQKRLITKVKITRKVAPAMKYENTGEICRFLRK
jgi:hypothetical protein